MSKRVCRFKQGGGEEPMSCLSFYVNIMVKVFSYKYPASILDNFCFLAFFPKD